MKSEPDGVSLMLMQRIAKEKGLKYVSKSHMWDIKKTFSEKLWPPKPGDESLIVSCARVAELTGEFPKTRTEAYRALSHMRHKIVERRIEDDCADVAAEAVKLGVGAPGAKLAVAVLILRKSGIKAISLYPESGVESVSFFQTLKKG